jgi:hypothetical protein
MIMRITGTANPRAIATISPAELPELPLLARSRSSLLRRQSSEGSRGANQVSAPGMAAVEIKSSDFRQKVAGQWTLETDMKVRACDSQPHRIQSRAPPTTT